jgi:hypothetical protein
LSLYRIHLFFLVLGEKFCCFNRTQAPTVSILPLFFRDYYHLGCSLDRNDFPYLNNFHA